MSHPTNEDLQDRKIEKKIRKMNAEQLFEFLGLNLYDNTQREQ